MEHRKKTGKPQKKNRSGRYRSLRAAGPWTVVRRVIAAVECSSIRISEALAQLIRHLVALPGRLLDVLLARAGLGVPRQAAALLVCTLAGAMLVHHVASSFPNAYAVQLDGQTVAVVSDYGDVEDAVKDYLAQHSDHFENIHYTDHIEYLPVRAESEEISAEDDVAALCSELNFVAVGCEMYVDGEKVAVLQAEEDGQRVIEEIIAGYQPQVDAGTLEITDVDVAEDIQYVQTEVGIDSFTEFESFKDYLMHGEEVQRTYTVKKNDTLSQIAERFSLTTSELREANPRHRDGNSYLQIGEVLNLNVVEKPIHVVAQGKLVREESIPYKTEYVSDSTLWRGQYKTIESGEYGSKDVEYTVTFENGQEVERLEVAEVVTADPVPKQVASGTKYIMASRGDGGGGQVAWPLRGRITSPFGWRATGFHHGLDIAGNVGDPLYASESGVVTYAAWSGAYGRLIKIDHGDGLETRYAHLYRYRVTYGEKVERGDLIGLVGSSGNSTGPHLHFEVRINGVAKNPINYLD